MRLKTQMHSLKIAFILEYVGAKTYNPSSPYPFVIAVFFCSISGGADPRKHDISTEDGKPIYPRLPLGGGLPSGLPLIAVLCLAYFLKAAPEKFCSLENLMEGN